MSEQIDILLRIIQNTEHVHTKQNGWFCPIGKIHDNAKLYLPVYSDDKVDTLVNLLGQRNKLELIPDPWNPDKLLGVRLK